MNFIIIILALLIVDLIYSPIVINRIRKSGNIEYLFDSIHRFLLLVAVLYAATLVPIFNENMFVLVIFSVVFLFIFNYNFEINKFIFENAYGNNIQYEKFPDDMKEFFKDDKEIFSSEKISVFGRGKRLLKDYVGRLKMNFSNLIDVVICLITGKEYVCFSSVVGIKTIINGLAKKEYLKMFINRIVSDVLMVILFVSILIVLA